MVESIILHICILTSTRVFDISYGGEGRFATSLAKWLANKSHDVTLMGSTFTGIKAKRLSKIDVELILKNYDNHKKRAGGNHKNKKVKVIYPPYPIYLFSRLVMIVLWFMKILLINTKSPIELIHAQDTGYSGLAAVLSGKVLRVPVIISSHGIRHLTLKSVLRGKLKKLLLEIERRLDTFVINNADVILVVNPAIKQYFLQILKSTKRIDVIPIPIKLSEFEYSEKNRDEMRKEIGIITGDKNMRVVGFVGRFSPEKNLSTLINSFANVVEHNPFLKLVLVGTGHVEHELREYAKERAIEDKVIFCGVRYDIGRVLAGLDIFVLPSFTEGLSTALLEAMASGRAIICSDIPANRQLVTHNQEGLFVNPYDAVELELAIRLLSSDDSLRLKLGQNAKIKANQFDEEKVFSKIMQVYEGFLQ